MNDANVGPNEVELDALVGSSASKTRIQSVSRAMNILAAVAVEPDGMTAKEISSRFRLALPTAYHLLSTLCDEGFLARGLRRQYVIGPRSAVIAQAVDRDMSSPESYLVALRSLAGSTGETAYVSAWRRGGIAVLATVEGAHAVRVTGLTTGYSENMHARASGKLLMACARDDVRERFLRDLPLPALTPNTITDRKALAIEFDRIRDEGLSYDHQEFMAGVECISAPIYEDGVVVGCFTVSTPTSRFDEKEDLITSALVEAAASVSNNYSA